MIDIFNIKFTREEILDIDFRDNYYRNIDLELYAKQNEESLLSNRIAILPYIFFSPDVGFFEEIYRVTINKSVRDDKTNNRLFKIGDLKYPPKKALRKVYYNRASYKNQSIFYGGFGDFEALFENPPELGDLYTISKWRQKANTQLCFVSIFHDEKLQDVTNNFHNYWNHYIDQLEKLDDQTAAAVDKIFSLITYFFMRQVNPLKKIEYIFSAQIANTIFNLPYTPNVEAILYPSVQARYISSNLAVLPDTFDRKFEFVSAQEFIIAQKKPNKFNWFAEKTGETNSISDENLIWENPKLDNNLIAFLVKHKVDLNNYQ